VNTGGFAANHSPVDIFGNPRILGGVIDMGAVEYNPNTSVTEIMNPISVYYPNPAHGLINIKTSAIYSSIEIYTIQMQKVFELPFTEKVDVSFLSNGIYILKCKGQVDGFVKIFVAAEFLRS
jgi:hypothetical protein